MAKKNIQSTPTNTPVLTNSIEHFQSLFPNSHISNWFLANIVRVEKEDLPCKTCGGFPCTKKTNCGFQHYVVEVDGELYIKYRLCAPAKIHRHQSLAKKKFSLAKIPEKYVGKSFEDYQVDAGNQNAVKGAKFILENDAGYYIFGSPGTGKTFLAAILAQEFLRQGKSVIFGDVPTLLDQLKGTFDSKSESRLEDLMAALSNVDVLILDDLGTETPSEWAVERIYLIINSRYNAGKKLIVTSNYSPEKAATRLNNPKNSSEGITGSRIISRIKQMCKVAKIDGNDKRIKK